MQFGFSLFRDAPSFDVNIVKLVLSDKIVSGGSRICQGGAMASALASLNGGLGRSLQLGSDAEPLVGGRGRSPP